MTTATEPTLTVERCDRELEAYREKLLRPDADRDLVMRLVDRWLDLRLTCGTDE